MYKRTTTVVNKSGLHARPASDFVQAAGKFESKITIRRTDEEDEANAKSIVFVLSLGVSKGTEVELCAKGTDEQEAVDSLVALIESGFGEE
jgi:phosphocarrier protein